MRCDVDLAREGLSVTADALAAIADFVSTQQGFDIKYSPTRGLCVRPSRATVLDPTRHPEVKHSIAQLGSAESIDGAASGRLDGWLAYSHPPAHYLLGTQGFGEAGARARWSSEDTCLVS